MVSSRTYLIGLPVLVTVDDDGTVTYDMDTSETGEAIREEGALGVSDEQIEADAKAADREHERRYR